MKNIATEFVRRVSGTCRCHGIQVSGPLNLTSRPKQPYRVPDIISGKAVSCWWVADGGNLNNSHDVPTDKAKVEYE